MSIHWSIVRARELADRRKKQNKCRRCGQLYFKTETQCPHCSELSDHQIRQALAKRAKFRLGLGKGMFIMAMAIIVLLLLL